MELEVEVEGSDASGGDFDGSPITSVAPDHVFTILLLLPIDSILSFSLTCRRFRALSSSDTLWEAICRREWGSASVDALKSYHHSHLPWMRVFNQLSHLHSVYCHRLSDPDAESSLPSPRASHSLNYVSDCLVLFGGGCEGGRHLDDTWVAYVGNDCHRVLNWQRMSSGIPSGRFGHTCNVVGDFLILFGGINDNGIRQNDTWVGRVERNEIHVIGFSWIPIDVGVIAPPPRGAHASCCFDDKKMVIHGGIGLCGIRLFDTWVLELSENLKFGAWHEIVPHPSPSPPARSGHTLTSIGGMKVVLFGGRGVGYDVLNDIWLLSIFEGHVRWVQILYELQNVTERASLPRVGHSANLILGGCLLIYGGEDSERRRKDDFWALDVSAIKAVEVQQTTTNSIGLSAKMWKRLKANGCTPSSRSFHRACTDRFGRYLYVLGGMTDSVVQPSESPGLRFDGDLFLVDLVI